MRNLSPYFGLVECFDEVETFGVDDDYLDMALNAAALNRLTKATYVFLTHIEEFYPDEAEWLVSNYINKEDGIITLYNKCNKNIEGFLCRIFSDLFYWLMSEPKYLCDIIYITSTAFYDDWQDAVINDIKNHDDEDENAVLKWLKEKFGDLEDYPF